MHTRDTVDSEPPASSLPDSWPTETGRITHARCFGRLRPRAPCYAAADTRGMEGRAAPVPASRPPSLAASAGTDVQVPGWRGGGVATSSAGRGHRGHRHRAQAWRAFSLHLTSCLCHPSATPSLLGARATKHRWTLQRGRTSPHPSWFKGRKQNSHFCAAVGLLNWSK